MRRLDDPSTGQFHGTLSIRKHVGPAIVVKTSPTDDAVEEKGFHYHELDFFWSIVRGGATETLSNGKERPYQPLVPSFTPAGELHAHRRTGEAPVGLGIILIPGATDLVKSLGRFRCEPHEVSGAAAIAAMARLSREVEQQDEASQMALEGIVYEVIAYSTRFAAGTREVSVPTWLKAARDLIHDRFRDSLRISEVAKLVGIHPVHLSSEFRRYYGSTPGQYLREVRLGAAATALTRNDSSISDLAAGYGFFDEAHFAKAFKAAYGMTPSQYRESQKTLTQYRPR